MTWEMNNFVPIRSLHKKITNILFVEFIWVQFSVTRRSHNDTVWQFILTCKVDFVLGMTAWLGNRNSWILSCCHHLIFLLVFFGFGFSNASSSILLDVGTEAVAETEGNLDAWKTTFATLLIGGNKTEKYVESLSGTMIVLGFQVSSASHCFQKCWPLTLFVAGSKIYVKWRGGLFQPPYVLIDNGHCWSKKW